MEEVWKDGDEHYNWVIIQDNGEPLRFTTGELVIYGSAECYESGMVDGDHILTLGEYAESLGVHWRTLIQ
jgi:hypothetical protein